MRRFCCRFMYGHQLGFQESGVSGGIPISRMSCASMTVIRSVAHDAARRVPERPHIVRVG
eukprot:scaffold7478_cov124-Isochrysis_galbana.AAC.3